MMVSDEKQIPLEGPQVDERSLDMAVKALSAAPICCRCGAQLQGVPPYQTVQCPRCKHMMRHMGKPWLEYVSLLEVPAGAAHGLKALHRR